LKVKKTSKEDRMIELLEELVKWTKVTSIPKVKDLLLEILQSPQEKIAYQSSDGRSSSEVGKEANVSYVTVTLWWKRWIKAGIAKSVSARGGQRAKRVFSLDDFGIEVPSIEKPKIEEEEKDIG
jgi:hypothetical protein